MTSHSETKVEKKIANKDGKNITTTTTTTTKTVSYSGDTDNKRSILDDGGNFIDDDFLKKFDNMKTSGTATYKISTSSNGGPPEVKTYTGTIEDGIFNNKTDDIFNKFDPSKNATTTTTYTYNNNNDDDDDNNNKKVYTTTTFTSSSSDPFADLEKFKKEMETTFFDNDDFRKQFWSTNFNNHYNDNIDSSWNPAQYEKLSEQPNELPDEYTLYAKPTQDEVKYEPCPYDNRKKALLIGINYKDPYRLNGCINDVKNIKKYLTEYWGFPESNMTVLTDDLTDPNKLPTRANITREMKNLVKGVEKGDSLFFHYSGHGGQQIDPDHDEDDGYDETIMPLDFQTAGQIVDDEMHNIMVDPLPAGVGFTAIFDSCHSGTVLDLPYIYSTQGHVKQHKIVEGGSKKNSAVGERIRRKNLATKSSPAEVIMFSGCKDEQTSSDVTTNGVSTGAMSHAFVKALQQGGKDLTYKDLLNRLRAILRERYSQRPQLSSSHKIDMNKVFKM
ncbi:hypothetical protein Glove_340g31 [Diversispora epigaea]|uniref:Peptidase C14 caspase domain-containing protein n=1 Tax=Diversispora epigaea TaxID=1348612 RepID=A0A397HMJ4_9GLOM|nr:hypothetical protein Glove_340g31 [Diversispora epigaea]